MKPQLVSDIKTKLLRPALTSHFEIILSIPEAIRSTLGTEQEVLNLQCCDASLPGSRLATLELNNNRTGVTEKHVHRRMFDESIDFTFYIDAANYMSINFFEKWISYISGEDDREDLRSKNYYYRMRYPDDYIANQGLVVRKFERDYKNYYEYEFIRSFPFAIASMPVSYESSQLLKCTVSMSYIRYIVKSPVFKTEQPAITTPAAAEQAKFNASNLTLPGLEGAGALSTGGVPQSVANSSGNKITLTGQDYTRRRQGLD